MPTQLLRGSSTLLPLTTLFLTLSAHAVLPTPTETTVGTGEVSYTANPNANPNAPTFNTPTAGRVITVSPQHTPIENPLGQTAQSTSVMTTPPATTTQITATPIHQTVTTNQTPTAVSQPSATTSQAPITISQTPTAVSQTPITTSPVRTTAPVSTAPATPSLPKTPTIGIQTVVNAFIVQNINGQERLVPVNVGTPVKSGDVLEYQGLFTNNSPERVRSMEVSLTIADGLELIGGIHPRFPYASIDGNRFVRSPIRANVGGQVQELPLSQYKALRWTIEDVGLGGTAVVKYRAKVK